MLNNPEYDLAKPLETAIKAKAPYVGIPMPGYAPLIFKRSLLAGALKGVKVAYIEANTLEDGSTVLTVEGTAGPRTRTRCHLRAIPRESLRRWNSEPRKAMDKWMPTMMPKPIVAKQTKFDKAIIVLEKRLAKLRDRPHLTNPATLAGHPSHNHESCLKWYKQKSLRGQVGAIGKMARTGKLDSRECYKALDALTGIGKVTRYSELDKRQKDSLNPENNSRWSKGGTFLDYADPKRLWKFMPSLKTWNGGKPYSLLPMGDMDYSDLPRWGVKRYEPVLEWLRQRQEILSAIQGIRDMQTKYDPTPSKNSESEEIAA